MNDMAVRRRFSWAFFLSPSDCSSGSASTQIPYNKGSARLVKGSGDNVTMSQRCSAVSLTVLQPAPRVQF